MSTDSTDGAAERPTEEITVIVNGEPVTAEVEPRLKLSDFSGTECDLHGVRVGCEHGVCGACTVQQDGRTTKSCLSYAVQADGAEIRDRRGTRRGGDGLAASHSGKRSTRPTRSSVAFCTSGFVMATKELLEENPDPTREEIEEGLADNICRCTGYQNIYERRSNGPPTRWRTDHVYVTPGRNRRRRRIGLEPRVVHGARGLPRVEEDHCILTGEAEYIHDITPENCLHMALVRSMHAHAEIVSIDTEEAGPTRTANSSSPPRDIKGGYNPMPTGVGLHRDG